MNIKPKLHSDIIVKYSQEGKWNIKASYGDKKKSKLWIQIFAKNESKKETIFLSILFLNGEFNNIVWIEYNGKMLKNIDQVNEDLRQLLVNAAIEESKKYIK